MVKRRKILNELNYMKDYKNDEYLRKSFNELATMVFGINFELRHKHKTFCKKEEKGRVKRE
jgi:hypothetical protein